MHTAARGTEPKAKAGRLSSYLLATRPMFFTATLLPVILGTAWGAGHAHSFNLVGFLLAMLTIVCVHACINVVNDVCDDINGTDRINRQHISPYSGGSRFIQESILSRAQMRNWAIVLGVSAAALGSLLVLREGGVVLWLGIAGLGLGLLYSIPPVALVNRGLGEVAVGVGAGLLPVIGAAWLQTHQWAFEPVLLALPASIWVSCILLINEIPDAGADEQSGKRTLVVRLGPARSLLLYALLNLTALGLIAYLAWIQLFPWWALLLPAILLLMSLRKLRGGAQIAQSRSQLTGLIRQTLTNHMLGILWLTASLII